MHKSVDQIVYLTFIGLVDKSGQWSAVKINILKIIVLVILSLVVGICYFAGYIARGGLFCPRMVDRYLLILCYHAIHSFFCFRFPGSESFLRLSYSSSL